MQKRKKSTQQHVATQMHAREKNVSQTRAHQEIWGKWQKCPPCAQTTKEEKKSEGREMNEYTCGVSRMEVP